MASSRQTVRDVMSTELLTLRRNDQFKIADHLMKQERIRHLPVLDEDDRLCGIVSQRDLFRGALVRALGFGPRAEERMLETLSVKEIMTEGTASARCRWSPGASWWGS